MVTKVLTGEIVKDSAGFDLALVKSTNGDGPNGADALTSNIDTRHPVGKYLFSLKSEGSIRTQRSALAQVIAALDGKVLRTCTKDEGIYYNARIWEYPWHKFTNGDLGDLQSTLVHLNYAGNTVQRTMAATRRVMKKCTRLKESNPYYLSPSDYALATDSDDWTKLDRSGEHMGRKATNEELALLFDACRWRFRQGTDEIQKEHEHEAFTLRDRAISGLLFFRGLRVNEIVNLNLSHYNTRTGELRITKSKTPAGKRTFELGGRAKLYMDDWIRLRGTKAGRIFYRILKGGEIRPKGDHLPLSTNAIRKMLDKRCNIAGIPRLTTHDGRRTFVTTALDAGVAPEKLRGIVGHASVEQTMKYSRYSNVERLAALDVIDAVQETIFAEELPEAA